MGQRKRRPSHKAFPALMNRLQQLHLFLLLQLLKFFRFVLVFFFPPPFYFTRILRKWNIGLPGWLASWLACLAGCLGECFLQPWVGIMRRGLPLHLPSDSFRIPHHPTVFAEDSHCHRPLPLKARWLACCVSHSDRKYFTLFAVV